MFICNSRTRKSSPPAPSSESAFTLVPLVAYGVLGTGTILQTLNARSFLDWRFFAMPLGLRSEKYLQLLLQRMEGQAVVVAVLIPKYSTEKWQEIGIFSSSCALGTNGL